MTDLPTCCIEGCDREMRSRGMCYPHYLRWRRGARGDELTAPVAAADTVRRCELDGCDSEHYATGLCRAHYRAEWAGRDPRTLKRNPRKAYYRAGPPPPSAA